MGAGLFFARMSQALRESTRLTGIEYDPITARIARLIHPEARVRCEDYRRSPLSGSFDLAIGNPPFADRVVKADPVMAGLGLRLHDYFIARSIQRLRPGGLAIFVTRTGTMDKLSSPARAPRPHARPARRGAPAREQHEGPGRHRARGDSPRVPA